VPDGAFLFHNPEAVGLEQANQFVERHRTLLAAANRPPGAWLLLTIACSRPCRKSQGRVPRPLPIRLWPGKYREPDIAYFRPGRIRDPRQPPDGADLVMEVASEGEENRKRDLQTKREEYARAGIAEYWIVDHKSSASRCWRWTALRTGCTVSSAAA
jgi:hypothetical protein